jgi:hypothetical protein
MRLRNPWWIVVGSVLGLMVGNGPIMQFTFGVLLKPISDEFRWDRATVSSAIVVGLCAGEYVRSLCLRLRCSLWR